MSSATVQVSNTPKFCTVTVILNNGVKSAYAIGDYVANLGDTYLFTAQLGGYAVDVDTEVVDQQGELACRQAREPPSPLSDCAGALQRGDIRFVEAPFDEHGVGVCPGDGRPPHLAGCAREARRGCRVAVRRRRR